MNKLFLSAFFPLVASVTNISSYQHSIEDGNDCMGQRRPGINIHDLLFEDDQMRKLSYPTYCCDDYYIRFTHSSIPSLATSSFGNRTKWVVDISMNNMNISKILPGTFTGLHYLNCLDLSQNNISFIQYGLVNGLERLYVLNLANNNIKQIFHNAFDNVPLEKLFLQNNMLSFLDDNLLSSLKNSLTSINLSRNILKVINNTFVGMNSLISLNLDHNKIENVNLANLYSTEIYLRNNRVSHNSAIRGITRIIDLSENNIQSIEDLGSGFINSSIEKLYLSRNSIQLKHNSLVGLYQLTHLYLDNNKVSNISSMVFKDVKSLIHLDISHNDISHIQYGAFVHMRNMQYLNISCNKFKKPQLHKISHILSLIGIIDLSDNKIQLIEDLGSGFINSSLAKLYLSRNSIKLNQNSLVGLYNLTHLYLDNNNVTNISKMVFQDLNSLIFLDISHNDIVQFQYDTFDHLGSMQYLNISFNKLTELQLQVFSPLPKLIELDFRNNQITELDIESFLSQCYTLQKLKMDGNLWKCKALKYIIEYCQTRNVEVVWGNSVDFENVRGIACDSGDFAINTNTNENNGTEKNINKNNVSDIRFLKNSSAFNSFGKDFEKVHVYEYLENVPSRKTTDAIINLNSTSFYNFSNYGKSTTENNRAEKNINENNVFNIRFSKNSSVFNSSGKDFETSDVIEYLENLPSTKPTDAINLTSTSFYNFSNYEQRNLFKYFENLRLRNYYEFNETPVGYFHFHFIFSVLLIVILVMILTIVFTILILLLKKGSYKPTRNISHQDNVELL